MDLRADLPLDADVHDAAEVPPEDVRPRRAAHQDHFEVAAVGGDRCAREQRKPRVLRHAPCTHLPQIPANKPPVKALTA